MSQALDRKCEEMCSNEKHKLVNLVLPRGIYVNENGIPSAYDNYYEKRASEMRGFYQDGDALEEIISKENVVVYRVYEFKNSESSNDLVYGVSIVAPLKIGKEYNMTKGHFHETVDTSEIYFCLNGDGYMVMETETGVTECIRMTKGTLVYVAPYFSHRTVNTGNQEFINLFCYPAHAGHDYRTIEKNGFRKIIFEEKGEPIIVDK